MKELGSVEEYLSTMSEALGFISNLAYKSE
jgi:hypothetical protein